MIRFNIFARFIVFLICSAALLGASNKDRKLLRANENFHFRFKLNGKPKDYSQALMAYQKGSFKGPFVESYLLPLLGDTVKAMSISSLKFSSSLEALSILLYDSVPIVAGVYKDNEQINGGHIRAHLVYQPVNGLVYQSGGFFKFLACQAFTDTPVTDTTMLYADSTVVTLSDITARTIRGSFSGKLYQYSIDGSLPLTDSGIWVTDGSFYLPMK